MKPDGVTFVEYDSSATHLEPMSKTYQADVIFESDSGTMHLLVSQPLTVRCAWGSNFQSAFERGLSASTALFSTPASYAEFSVPTVAQCFGIVGSYLSETMPSVPDDGRTQPGRKSKAA